MSDLAEELTRMAKVAAAAGAQIACSMNKLLELGESPNFVRDYFRAMLEDAQDARGASYVDSILEAVLNWRSRE